MNRRFGRLIAVILGALVLIAALYGAARYASGQMSDSPGAASATSEADVAPPTPTPQAEATLPPSPTALATDIPIPAATTSVQLPPTAPATIAPTPVTPGPLGCGDCKVRQRDQLPVSAQDVEMDSQGKYFIPDRGDGCRYAETYRGTDYPGRQEVMLWAAGCEQGWTFLPATGELIPTVQ